jgi:hypothetical protein
MGATDIGGLILPTWILWVIAIATIVGAGHTIWTKAVRPVVRGMKTIAKTYEKVSEYDDRLKMVESHTKELKNNSGSSMRDAVDRIEKTVNGNTKNIDAHLKWANNQTLEVQQEIREVWKTLAARDVVDAALHVTETKDERGETK